MSKKTFKNVSKCLKIFKNVSKCLKISQNVSKCLEIFQNVSNVSKCLKMSPARIIKKILFELPNQLLELQYLFLD